jgi:hypothetical protein
MALFNIGDYVERVGSSVPDQMRFGRIVRVVTHKESPEYLTEYVIDFGFVLATYNEAQLRLAEEPPLQTTATHRIG